jgi:hypothetical protein
MLLCFTVDTHGWVEKKLAYSPLLDRHYFGKGIVSHDEMLWWSTSPTAYPWLRHVQIHGSSSAPVVTMAW